MVQPSAGQKYDSDVAMRERTRNYSEVKYQPNDYLIFGRETAGLPKDLLAQYQEQCLHIPMFHPQVRSLNLSNCVALVLYEALRQLGFKEEQGN